MLAQKSTKSGAAAGQSGLYRPNIDIQNFGNLFVGKALDLSQNDNRPERLRDLSKSLFYPMPQLSLDRMIEW